MLSGRGHTSRWKCVLCFFTVIVITNLTQIRSFSTLSDSFVTAGRILAEAENTTEINSHLDDTVRVDPLDSFKKYRGGYDVTNKHYWSSTVYTGIPGYAIAVLWILCGVGYGIFILVRKTCLKRSRKLKKRSCHKQCHLLPLLLAIFITVLAITACGLVLGGNKKFHSRAKTIIDIIIDTADEASYTIYDTTRAMKEMSSSLGDADGNADTTRFLTSTSAELNSQADEINRQAYKNRRLIDKVLKIAYVVTTVVISLTLVAVVAMLGFGILKFSRTLQVFIAVCWIFTAICWFLFGIYFFLQNFAGDTCTALEGFQKDPYNNSLSSILPCDELLSAKSVLRDVSAGIYDMVNEVNRNISSSYGNIVQICNPFSPPPTHEYEPWNCPATSIQIGQIPQVLRVLACPDIRGNECNGGILLPANYYNMVEAYTTSIQKLLDVYPGMEQLVECQTVKDAFSEILQNHCKPLKRYVRLVRASLVFLSCVMVALVLVNAVKAHHEQNHHSSDGSVKPDHHHNDGIEIEYGMSQQTVDKLKPAPDV